MKPQTKAVLSVFEKGVTLTSKSARKAGVKCLSARVSELRREGYAIYTKRTKEGVKYQLGTPTREMVKTVYNLLGNAPFEMSTSTK